MTAAAPGRAVVWPLDAATYVAHPFHRQESNRVWLETNCYVDLWIEMLWKMGVEPTAALAFTFGIDFEGDQWTFFKFPTGDLQRLYGVDTQELAIFGPPEQHAAEQVARGRLVMMELDSFHLPDTAGTAYGREHVKTTVGIQDIDVAARRLGYFHNAGYYAIEGDDFTGLFRMDDPWTPASARLLPYTEFVKMDALERREPAALVDAAANLAREHLRRRPKQNPFLAWKPRLAADVERLRAADTAPGAFHAYAFATMRQFGASFELASDFLKWMTGHGVAGLGDATAACEAIANGAKAMQFKLARAATLKRAFASDEAADGLAAQWDVAMGQLVPRFGA